MNSTKRASRKKKKLKMRKEAKLGCGREFKPTLQYFYYTHKSTHISTCIIKKKSVEFTQFFFFYTYTILF